MTHTEFLKGKCIDISQCQVLVKVAKHNITLREIKLSELLVTQSRQSNTS